MVVSIRGARFALRSLFVHTSVLFLCLHQCYRTSTASSTNSRSGFGLMLAAATATKVHVSAAVAAAAATTREELLFEENEKLGVDEALGVGTTEGLEDYNKKRGEVLVDNDMLSPLLFTQTAAGAKASADTTAAVEYDDLMDRPSHGTASAPGGGGSSPPERQEGQEEGEGRGQRGPGWEKQRQRRLRRRREHLKPSRKMGAIADNDNEISAVGREQNNSGQQHQTNGDIYTPRWSSSTAAQQPNPTKQANNANNGSEHPPEKAFDTQQGVEGGTEVVPESGGEGEHEDVGMGNDAGTGMVKFRLGGDVDSFTTGDAMRGYLNLLVKESVAATNNQVYLR